MKTIKQVQAVIFNQNKVVLLKKRDSKVQNGKWIFLKKTYWRLMKGKLEKNETPLQGLKRELHEECGFTKILSAELSYTYEYEAPKGTLRKVKGYIVLVDQKPRLTADAKKEGIVKIQLFEPKKALTKLHWEPEKKSLKAAFKYKNQAKAF